jgi:hypothetical protein
MRRGAKEKNKEFSKLGPLLLGGDIQNSKIECAMRFIALVWRVDEVSGQLADCEAGGKSLAVSLGR